MNFWEGERVSLRALEPDDATFFFELQKDTERNRLLEFLPPPSSLAALATWVREQSQREFKNDAFQWLIESKAGERVGSIVTHSCNLRNGTFSYALDIAAAAWRKGYAAEAVSLVLRYYFGELRYQKVYVGVQSDNSNNDASVALHQKLGFRLEGTQQRQIFQQGRYLDLLFFGFMAEDFF